MRLLVHLLQSQAGRGDVAGAQVPESLPAGVAEEGVGRGDENKGVLPLFDDASEVVACLLALTTDAPAGLWEDSQVIEVRHRFLPVWHCFMAVSGLHYLTEAA